MCKHRENWVNIFWVDWQGQNTIEIVKRQKEVQNKKQDALQHFQKALQLQPSLIEVYLKIGNLQIQFAGRNKEKLAIAKNTFLAGKERCSIDERLHCNLGFVELLLDNYAAAEKSLLEAVRLSPDYLLAWENLWMVYYQTNELVKAKKCLTEILRIQPEYPKKQELMRLSGGYRQNQ